MSPSKSRPLPAALLVETRRSCQNFLTCLDFEMKDMPWRRRAVVAIEKAAASGQTPKF